VAISGNQWQSEAIRRNQTQSVAISRNQSQSVAISRNQSQSVAIDETCLPAPEHRRRHAPAVETADREELQRVHQEGDEPDDGERVERDDGRACQVGQDELRNQRGHQRDNQRGNQRGDQRP